MIKSKDNYLEFLAKINADFTVRVHELNILSDYAFELVVYAPALANKTKLGHIFRLHNYHNLAETKKDTLLAMEGVALTVYKVDRAKGLIGVIIINAGGSSALVKNFKKGDPLIFMGPSGTPTRIDEDKKVLLIAGGRGNLPLAMIAKEYRQKNGQAILFAGYKKAEQIVRLDELVDNSDILVLAIEEKAEIKGLRKQDLVFEGKVTDAVLAYGNGQIGVDNLNYEDIDVMLTMGNEMMMDEVSKICYEDLKGSLKPGNIGIASLNNPMQCMLKGICSQCLQLKIDPETNKKTYFYSCINQDQKIDMIDFDFLKNRCGQNSLQEKLTKNWIKYIQ